MKKFTLAAMALAIGSTLIAAPQGTPTKAAEKATDKSAPAVTTTKGGTSTATTAKEVPVKGTKGKGKGKGKRPKSAPKAKTTDPATK
jgi:hypothetical protein